MNYLLATNVVSELRKIGDGKADARVAAWVDTEDAESFFISAITILELERGVLGIQRRDAAQGARLRAWLDNHVRPEFAGRILPIDDQIAMRCAHLHIPDRRNEVDALIGACPHVFTHPLVQATMAGIIALLAVMVAAAVASVAVAAGGTIRQLQGSVATASAKDRSRPSNRSQSTVETARVPDVSWRLNSYTRTRSPPKPPGSTLEKKVPT